MTPKQVKELVAYMREMGVKDFAYDGLSVAFEGRPTPNKNTSARDAALRANKHQRVTLEEMFTAAGAHLNAGEP